MIEHLEILAIGFLLGASATTLVYAVAHDVRRAMKPPRIRRLYRLRPSDRPG
jgi:hypothetical protein